MPFQVAIISFQSLLVMLLLFVLLLNKDLKILLSHVIA